MVKQQLENGTQLDQTTFCLLMGPALPVIVASKQGRLEATTRNGSRTKECESRMTMNGLTKTSLVYIQHLPHHQEVSGILKEFASGMMSDVQFCYCSSISLCICRSDSEPNTTSDKKWLRSHLVTFAPFPFIFNLKIMGSQL